MQLSSFFSTVQSVLSQWSEATLGHRDRALLTFIEQHQNDPEAMSKLEPDWDLFQAGIFHKPQYISFLFPKRPIVALEVEVVLAKHQDGNALTYGAFDDWLRKRFFSKLPAEQSLFDTILPSVIKNGRVKQGWIGLSRFFVLTDLFYCWFVKPEYQSLYDDLLHAQFLQKKYWPHSYCNGYFYQGFAEIGVRGVKPAEDRYKSYELDRYVTNQSTVLDIGSNAGFLAMLMAKTAKHVNAVELNPFLTLAGSQVAGVLDLENVSHINNDFQFFKTEPASYDVILSLSNHATIDNKLSINFEDYILKIDSLLKPGGYFIFESHNIHGPGKGGPGDDGDIDEKLAFMATKFTIRDKRMVSRKVPHSDIDKLFVVLEKAI